MMSDSETERETLRVPVLLENAGLVPYQHQPVVAGAAAATEEAREDDVWWPWVSHFFGPMMRLLDASW